MSTGNSNFGFGGSTRGDVYSVNGQTGAVELTTTNIDEGTNKYFTNARVLSATLTGYAPVPGIVIEADNVIEALEKIDANIRQASVMTKLFAYYNFT